ncbi:MAG: formate dehydrogenase subunit delta [Betaproteobacteria bacterium]|nr:formate dehydrogenase subunit delta [Betaproteobacteria bacterium]
MNAEHLIKMANDIGAFFEAMPNREQATKDVAAHIRKFWEPRMQKSLMAYLSTHGDAGLKDIVRDALREFHPA